MTGFAEAERIKSPNPPDHFEWTDERVEELKRLVADRDLSYRQIAVIMGGGVTRNAVLGKAIRMKLRGTEGRSKAPTKSVSATAGKRGQAGKNSARTVAARRARAVKAKPVSIHIEQPTIQPDLVGNRLLNSQVWSALPGAEPIPLLQLNEVTCKWPVGDAPILFCGLHPDDGSPYCAHHRAIAIGGRS